MTAAPGVNTAIVYPISGDPYRAVVRSGWDDLVRYCGVTVVSWDWGHVDWSVDGISWAGNDYGSTVIMSS
jgi:hypothetical protein